MTKRPAIPILTSLRFPAAAAIVVYHSFVALHRPAGVWDFLGSGVSFFYVLSGFILFYNYGTRFDRGLFWKGRCARIWPLHLATLILALLLIKHRSLWGWNYWPLVLPLNAGLLHAWVPYRGVTLSFNGVSWSLSVEAFFYFAFPWLVALLERRGIAALLGACFAAGLVTVGATELLAPAFAPVVATFNPLCRLFEFVLGMATCRLWLRESRRPAAMTLLEIAALVVALAAVVGLAALIPATTVSAPVVRWLIVEVGAVSFAFVIWVFAHQGGAFARAGSRPVFVLLGEISFAVYMCHQIILRWAVPDHLPHAALALHLAGALALVLPVSYALFRWVETPARRWIMRRGAPTKEQP
jgi:peptidoglycan/LPS O-acetylase OafA/YrhL